MAQEDFKRKLTSIFSADAVGYSRLMGENEAATVRTLTSYRSVISSLIKQHNGTVIDSMTGHSESPAESFRLFSELNKKAMRHNPYYPAYYLNDLVYIYRDLGRYEEALVTAQKLFARAQKGEFAFWLAHFNLALVYMLLDREKESKEHATELLKINPNFSLKWVESLFGRSKNPAFYEYAIEALRKAGIPEHPS